MCRFLDGQRVSTRVYVHTTANEAEKAAGGCDGSVIVFQTPHLSVVVRDVLWNHYNVFNISPSEHCGYNSEIAHSLDYMQIVTLNHDRHVIMSDDIVKDVYNVSYTYIINRVGYILRVLTELHMIEPNLSFTGQVTL